MSIKDTGDKALDSITEIGDNLTDENLIFKLGRWQLVTIVAIVLIVAFVTVKVFAKEKTPVEEPKQEFNINQGGTAGNDLSNDFNIQ